LNSTKITPTIYSIKNYLYEIDINQTNPYYI
jgi:hypothetical protein